VEGVRLLGPSKWAEIKKLANSGIADLLAARSAVDLKDKWRNLVRPAPLLGARPPRQLFPLLPFARLPRPPARRSPPPLPFARLPLQRVLPGLGTEVVVGSLCCGVLGELVSCWLRSVH
jgi:hypothetical protein